MERVTFIVEQGEGRHLTCMLNPESFTLRRWAGVEQRHSVGGIVTDSRMTDTPLLFTGGGVTELELDLLFDVEIAGSSIQSEDVRDLTAPFWELSENMLGADGYQVVPHVRLVWGKSWNIPGVITAVAERFDKFTAGGVPRRSWLRLRFVRTAEPDDGETGVHARLRNVAIPERREEIDESELSTHLTVMSERLDEIAYRYFGDPGYWNLLAWFNDIANPLEIPAGIVLKIPSLKELMKLQ